MRPWSRTGSQILGPANLPAAIPVHASQMYSKNIITLLGELHRTRRSAVTLDFENDVIGPATVTHGGEVLNERVRRSRAPVSPPAHSANAGTLHAHSRRCHG